MTSETSSLIDRLETEIEETRNQRNLFRSQFEGSEQSRAAQEIEFNRRLDELKTLYAAAKEQGEKEKGESMSEWGSWISSIGGDFPDAGGLSGIAALLLGRGLTLFGGVLKQRGERKAGKTNA
jgi:hypothetical protein